MTEAVSNLTIRGVENLTDPRVVALLGACVQRLAQHQRVKQAYIYANAVEKNDWLEHIMCIHYEDGGRITIGAIQRSAGAVFEFHS